MRRIYSFFSLVIVIGLSLAAEINAGDSNEYHAKPHQDLIGAIDKAALLNPPYQSWYSKNYLSYSPNEPDIETLAIKLGGIKVKVFMGTWCHDSQREVPRLFKVLERSNFDLSNLSLVSLSPTKDTPKGLEAGLNIQRTPTFIFYKDEAEIGRIVETPRESLESDILKIVSGQEYKHSYQN